MPENNRRNPFLAAPLLILLAMPVLVALKFASGALTAGGTALFIAAILALAALGIPIAAFFILGRQRVNPSRFRSMFGFRRPTGVEGGLLLSASLAVISLYAFFYYGLFRAGEAGTLLFFAGHIPAPTGLLSLAAIPALCLLPAICEEVLFRGVLLFEYRFAGGGAAFMTALFAAILTFDYRAALPAFFGALILSVVIYASGNFLCAILSNAAFRLLLLFAEPVMIRLSTHTESRTLYLLLTSLVLAGALFFVFFFAERCLHNRADREDAPPMRVPAGRRLSTMLDIGSSKILWADVALFLIIATADLIF